MRKLEMPFFRIGICIIMLACVFLQAGCSAVQASTEKRTPIPKASVAPTPSATPNASDNDNSLFNVFCTSCRSELVLLNNWTMEFGYSDAAYTTDNITRYILKEALIKNTLLPDAVTAVSEAAKQLTDKTVVVTSDNLICNAPCWQYLAAVLPSIADEADWLSVMNYSVNVTETESTYFVDISMSPMSIHEVAEKYAVMAGSVGDTANIYMNIRFTYAYLTALYDESGYECINTDFAYTSEYASTLVFPLASLRPSFRDTWAQGRSSNTRKHMGTDIKADEGVEIVSCCNGTVLYVGCDKIPGNYVIVIDDRGYEYHYYHMMELSDFVSAGDSVSCGDVIGLVGNTGNSDANHLHIAILEPSGMFVNPYNLMLELAES